jgi:RimJ/RimL family protein N-acetyltransferase
MLTPLETPRLDLRPAHAADLPHLRSLWNRPQVRRFLFDDPPVDQATASAALDACLAQMDQGLGLWLCAERGRTELLGCAGLLRVTSAAEYEPRLAGQVEPLLAFEPRVWGLGYASESLAVLIRYGFGALGLDRLVAVHDAPNLASERMLRAARFSLLSKVPGAKHELCTYLLDATCWRPADERF